MKIELPEMSGKVVSIEVAKQTSRYARRLFKECPHTRIQIDQTLTTLLCLDCGKDINPVIWLAGLVEEWHRLNWITDKYNEASKKLEEKSKAKCRHCGKMTPISR